MQKRSALAMATVGAALVWLSPASWMSAHGWPCSDVWVAPFYLFAVIAACAEGWFSAGVLLGIGAMFKGQEFMVAPLFVLWPLMMKRPEPALRWTSGFVFAFAAVAAPWLLRNGETHLVLWGAVAWVVVAGAVAAIVCVWIRRAWWIVGGALGAAVLICPLWFQSDTSWWQLAFVYGAQKFPSMSRTTLNLATLLDLRFGWDNLDAPAWNFGITFTVKQMLLGLYALGLAASALGMAMHSKTRDRRFLVAIAAPWIWAVAVMPQMHSRYLLFASTLGALAVGFSYWMVAVDLFLIAAAWIGVVHLLAHDQNFGFGPLLPENWAQFVWDVVDGSVPDLAWGVLACAVLYLVLALWKRRDVLPRGKSDADQPKQALAPAR